MNIQINKYIEPVKNYWGSLTKKKKIISCSILGGIVLVSVIAGILLNRQPYVILYPGLDHSEAVEVMNELKERNVSFKEDNGTIYVPKDQENALRMDLSNEGHPKTAPNYDFFTNNIGIMTTDYEKKIIEQYQLNQRLEAVIKTIDTIKNANVTISIPDSSGYALDDNAETPTASVTVTLDNGKNLSSSQVNGIKQLVSKSVPNMKAEDVAVIDTATGDELSGNSENGTQINITQFKLQIEKEYEKDVEKNILKVLTPVFGTNNVKVTVKSIMDVDKKVQEIITYNPSKDSSGNPTDKGVLSDSHTIKEQETSGKTAGGAAGTQSNAQATTYPGVTVNGDVIYTKDDQTYKYLVSQVKQQIQGDAASVQDMTISVVINKDMIADSQKQEIAQLVANAAAVQPEKVAIYNSTFATAAKSTNAQASGTLPLNTIVIIGGVVLLTLFIVGLIIFLVARAKKKKEIAMALAEQEDGTPLKDRLQDESSKEVPEEDIVIPAIEDARAQKATKEEALTKEIQEFTSQNPEIAAQLIRSWLKGEDNDG
ncbi:MAG: flagellar M-ring protein FliF [Clostridiales bacterium]|jgi:flagellar M-ring protein FliF|nr:flagellar M-ring protein FliF [Clostridiales bacterium]